MTTRCAWRASLAWLLASVCVGLTLGCSRAGNSSPTGGSATGEASVAESSSVGSGEVPTTPAEIHAAGSTFLNPMMLAWSESYREHAGATIDYNAVGSGKGLTELIEKRVDVACTDAPMTEKQLQQALQTGGEVTHVPLVMGAVVAAYNLPNPGKQLKLTGPLLADVFLGQIAKWNDPAIAAINPDAALPDLAITVVHRSDSSGTTNIFTEYLAKVSPEWNDGPGVGKEVNWPAGVEGDGNAGVSGEITRTAGAIGYVELNYAIENSLNYAAIQNKAGNFIDPSLEAVALAADGLAESIPENLCFSLTDPPGEKSYPIGGACWAVVYKKQFGSQGEAVLAFLRYATHEGQEMCESHRYARLPAGLIAKIDARLKEIQIVK